MLLRSSIRIGCFKKLLVRELLSFQMRERIVGHKDILERLDLLHSRKLVDVVVWIIDEDQIHLTFSSRSTHLMDVWFVTLM